MKKMVLLVVVVEANPTGWDWNVLHGGRAQQYLKEK